MEQIIHIEKGDPDEASDLAQALEIQLVLQKHYPNHPWLVDFSGHSLRVIHSSIWNAWAMVTGREGFCSLLRRNLRTAKELESAAIEAGGQQLEAFGMPRGPWDGRDPVVPRHLVNDLMRGKRGSNG